MRQDRQHFTHYEADTEDEEADVSAGYPDAFPRVVPQSAVYRKTEQQSASRFVQPGRPSRIPARASRSNVEVVTGPPPRPQPSRSQTEDLPRRRRLHPLVFVGIALFIAILGWIVLTTVANWWTNTEEQWTYGYPRTYQCDAVVGHSDSAAHPSHFIALNLSGEVEVIEFPGGDASHARIYTGLTVVVGQNASLIPVTLSFQDVNGDGLPDMIVTVGTSHYVFLNQKGQFVKSQN